ncbi:biofilm development regulator YmgB/AriR family protein [Pantoea agglomerans]|uniref:biofilm development regulator YmgB/AriR family protein n=1 Tax=Enterobacter agglomerans TaxID=549 RepID=UPI003AF26C01
MAGKQWRLFNRVEVTMRDNNSELLSQFLEKMNLSDENVVRSLIIGSIVCELMRSDKVINRKTICCKLVKRLELCESMEEKRIYYRAIRMLFGRQ